MTITKMCLMKNVHDEREEFELGYHKSKAGNFGHKTIFMHISILDLLL